MDKKNKIWLDGKLYAWDRAKIHVLSHSLHYGTGVFEGIRFYDTPSGPAIFRLDEHMDRLFYSAGCLKFKVPYTKKQLKDVIKQVLRVNKLTSGYIRPIIFYGAEHLGIHPRGCRVHTSIAAWAWGAYLGTKPVKTMISSFIRIHPKSTHAEAKICGHYVNSMLASIEAIEAGYDEAILLDYKGNLAEGPGENIFIVKKGILYTPSAGNILKGITRESIMEIATDFGIKAVEKRLTVNDLFTADEAFYSGTAAQISAIGSVNRKKIGNGKMGPVTKKLADRFDRIVHGKIPDYQHWLTPLK
jgi:branched-chain amino acid aminotransferase